VVVEFAAVQEEERLLVDEDAEAVALERLVALLRAVPDLHLVHEAGAAPADDADPEPGLLHRVRLGPDEVIPLEGGFLADRHARHRRLRRP
jgi:hypothetical protein